jgi:ribonuclease P protein component
LSANFSFKKSARLLQTREFHEVSRGEKRVGKNLVIYFIKADPFAPSKISPKLGLTVSRQFGKAHVRNKFKRLVREAFRLSAFQIPPQLLLNIKPRKYATQATFEEIQKEMLQLLNSNS